MESGKSLERSNSECSSTKDRVNYDKRPLSVAQPEPEAISFVRNGEIFLSSEAVEVRVTKINLIL